jgi:hypothetical protein
VLDITAAKPQPEGGETPPKSEPVDHSGHNHDGHNHDH